MEKRDYEMLVWSLEAEARDTPGLFRLKVILISLSAYLLLFGLLALAGLISWWLLGWALHSHRLFPKLACGAWLLTVLPVLFLSLRMMFTRLSTPEGRILQQQEAPRLFKLIDRLRKQLDAPPIHTVLLTREFNAAIAQIPRFGLMGGHRNYLILGLPFLNAMAPKEMMAVLAHEYGHLAGSHGKLSAWIYRQRRTFASLHEHASQRREGDLVNGIFATLLDQFAPYYNAYTFVLSRQNEYEADAISGRLAGAEASAAGLVRSELLAGWLQQQFWPKLYQQAAQRAAPSYMPFSAMRKIVGATMPEWATKEALQAAWKVDSGVHDTHPCLRERLQALDQACALPPDVSVSAADALLGEQASILAKEFDLRWWDEERANWQDYHRRYSRAGSRIDELSARSLESLDASEAQEFALLLAEYRGTAAAKPVLAHLLGRSGERYPKSIYYYGRVLLDEGDAQGLDYLEEAARLSPGLGDDCLRAGGEWLYAQQGEDAAERWLQKLSSFLR
ncbi:M48 family metallopeptidase [Chitinimonas naiadis]